MYPHQTLIPKLLQSKLFISIRICVYINTVLEYLSVHSHWILMHISFQVAKIYVLIKERKGYK